MESDDARVLALVVSWFVGLALVLSSPLVIWIVRRRTAGQRRWFARAWLGFGLASLWWLDAAVVMHAFNVEQGHPFLWHARVAGFFALVGLATTPWREGGWKEALAGPVALALAAYGVLRVPWNQEKRDVLAVERTLGHTLDVVQRELSVCFVSVWVEETIGPLPLDPQARVCDVDLVALAPCRLQVLVLGGCDMQIAGGRVVDVGFNYD